MHIGQLIGGLDIYIRNSIAYSANEGFEFIIVHGKNDNSKVVMCDGHPVKEYLVDLCRSLNPFSDLKCLFQVIKLIKREKPDIIHCHSAKGGFIGRLAGALTHTKIFYTPHAFSFLSSPSKWKQNVYLFLERIARLNSYLLACSESEREIGIRMVGYQEDRAWIWHNSVPDVSKTKGNIKINNERFISYIGRPCYQKNPFFLLDVIKKVCDIDRSIHFYLLGVGYHSPDLRMLKNRIGELGIGQNIVLVPWLNHDDCLEYVRKSMFYLTVSLYEGLPLSVLEAMALSKAVVASDVMGNRDCVCNGKNGYLLPLVIDRFVEKIIDLSQDSTKRKLFEKVSRDEFENHYLIDKQIKALHECYRMA